MERETFFYAYEGQYKLHFGVDLIDEYEGHKTQKFKNYISNIRLLPSEIVILLQDYQISVEGDVKLSGAQNDMRYFCMNTKREFDGLIDGFGNSRVALLCGHYEITDQYESDEEGFLQKVYKAVDRIMWVSVVLINYYEEPFAKMDIELVGILLKRLEKSIGMKIGICFSPKRNGTMELIPIEKFLMAVTECFPDFI